MSEQKQRHRKMTKNKAAANIKDCTANPPRTTPEIQKTNSSVNQPKAEQEHEYGEQLRPPGWTRYEKLSTFIQALTLLSLGVYTVFSGLMWRAMEASNKATQRSNEQNRRAFEASQRARLIVEDAEFTFDEAKQPKGGMVRIKNVGQMPATGVFWQVCLVNGELHGPMGLNPREFMYPMRDTLGPSATKTLPLSPPHYDLFCPKSLHPNPMRLLIARVRYMDGFDRERYVDTCRFWDPIGEIQYPDPALEAACSQFIGEGLTENLSPKQNSATPKK